MIFEHDGLHAPPSDVRLMAGATAQVAILAATPVFDRVADVHEMTEVEAGVFGHVSSHVDRDRHHVRVGHHPQFERRVVGPEVTDPLELRLFQDLIYLCVAVGTEA